MPKTSIDDHFITCIGQVENRSDNVSSDVWNGTSNYETNWFYWSLKLDSDKVLDDQSSEPVAQVSQILNERNVNRFQTTTNKRFFFEVSVVQHRQRLQLKYADSSESSKKKIHKWRKAIELPCVLEELVSWMSKKLGYVMDIITWFFFYMRWKSPMG